MSGFFKGLPLAVWLWNPNLTSSSTNWTHFWDILSIEISVIRFSSLNVSFFNVAPEWPSTIKRSPWSVIARVLLKLTDFKWKRLPKHRNVRSPIFGQSIIEMSDSKLHVLNTNWPAWSFTLKFCDILNDFNWWQNLSDSSPELEFDFLLTFGLKGCQKCNIVLDCSVPTFVWQRTTVQ